tara:strand:+ start:1020 stop:1256 length:237 start_codon:yes stop_codon:yes gene_type:complete
MNIEKEMQRHLGVKPKGDERLIKVVEGAGGDVKGNKEKLEASKRDVQRRALIRKKLNKTYKKGGVSIIKKRKRLKKDK